MTVSSYHQLKRLALPGPRLAQLPVLLGHECVSAQQIACLRHHLKFQYYELTIMAPSVPFAGNGVSGILFSASIFARVSVESPVAGVHKSLVIYCLKLW